MRKRVNFFLNIWSFPAESVFGAPTVLPNEFLQGDEVAVDSIIKNFQKTLDALAFSLPRHNSSSSLALPGELLAQLLSAQLVWVRRGGAVPLLRPLYDGPYAVICRGGRSFTLQIGSWEEVVAVSRLKACTTEDAALGGSPMETQSVRLRVYLRTRGYKTPVSITVHTPYINAYVIQIN
jgi:hypothetical protein